MAFQKLARVEEVPAGHTKYVCANGQPVILANYRGQVHALQGRCGHQGKPLDGAVLWDYLLDCPWHHFQYDVRTGENFFPSNVYPPDLPWLKKQVEPLRVYAVKVEDGDIWVDLEAG
jgi:3-phenylpropionate/trans-cinnamate dioxygenase ferredoxin component